MNWSQKFKASYCKKEAKVKKKNNLSHIKTKYFPYFLILISINFLKNMKNNLLQIYLRCLIFSEKILKLGLFELFCFHSKNFFSNTCTKLIFAKKLKIIFDYYVKSKSSIMKTLLIFLIFIQNILAKNGGKKPYITEGGW